MSESSLKSLQAQFWQQYSHNKFGVAIENETKPTEKIVGGIVKGLKSFFVGTFF